MQRRDLPLEFVRVVEMAAIASAQTMGQGERKHSDHVAVDAMRRALESVDIDGATGSPNAITVLAAAEKSGLLHAPDIYMEKLVVGLDSRGKVDINPPVAHNLRAIARTLSRDMRRLNGEIQAKPASSTPSLPARALRPALDFEDFFGL